jgi:hypothetical protein
MICRLNEMYQSSQLESSKLTQVCDNRILQGIDIENECHEQNKIYYRVVIHLFSHYNPIWGMDEFLIVFNILDSVESTQIFSWFEIY